MSLTNRLTVFFLGALALVLAGYTAALAELARSDLQRQVDERLDAALRTLMAAVELDAGGLEWEPNQRFVEIGEGSGPGEVRWTVRDGDGTLVALSRNLDGKDLLSRRDPQGRSATARPRRLVIEGRPWRVVRRRLQARGVGPPGLRGAEARHTALILTAGLDLAPVESTLRALVRGSAGLACGLWLLAAVLGRWLCRRALRPVARMAEAARGMSAIGRDRRLPGLTTGDELQDLGDAFNGLLDRLHDAFERQRRFTGDASHQLRTPLAAMLGQIEVALRRDRPADEYRKTLARAHDQALHLGRIVEMLLFLARADAESSLSGLDDIDLAGWVAADLGRRADHPRAVDLKLAPDVEGPLRVRVHPPLLAQLLDNLLDNACKYSPPGTPITIRLRREGERIALEVEDRGSGIVAEDLPRIFEPFYRASQARRDGRAGVGLGLAVAQRIAAAFHGTLHVHSTPGSGSRFVLLLPPAPAPVPTETLDHSN